MIIEHYYTNTTGGHYKDYRMKIDVDARTLICEWGPIGGAKQIDTYNCATSEELERLVEEKFYRRIRHGYILKNSETKETHNEFLSDLADLLSAEMLK